MRHAARESLGDRLRWGWLLLAIAVAVSAAWLGYRHWFVTVKPTDVIGATPGISRQPVAVNQPAAPTPVKVDVTPAASPAPKESATEAEQGPIQPSHLQPSPIQLRDVSAESGVTFRHTDGSSGQRYIVETVASGLATFDYDGDGLVDIYFANGAPLQGSHAIPRPQNRLYRNLGQFRFVDVTDAAGVGDTGYSLGVTVGDYNEDGYPDIYVSNLGPNVMYRNNGDGTFADVSRETGTIADDARKLGAGAAFLDADADGDLDLFVANYMQFSYDIHVKHTWRGVTIYSGPLKYPFYPSSLYRNDGNGSFTDVSREAGVDTQLGHGMGVICADVDSDGDTDIFVNNDGSPGNFLYRNDGTGKFAEVAGESGTALNAEGLALGSMGVDCGDYDNDGLLDFFITAYQKQLSTLFRNSGNGLFEDVTRKTGAGVGTFNRVTWGCGLVDLDNDGRRDIFLACGHLIDNVDVVDDTTTYAQTPIVMRNTDGARFVNVSAESGSGLKEALVARGAAFDDLDNDGDIDVVILNSRREATLLANESPGGHGWLGIQLTGTSSTRDAAGARVRVTAADLTQVSEVHRGRGYQSHFGSRLHFGLAGRQRVDRIEVQWLGGGADVLENVSANQIVTVIEGSTRATTRDAESD